MTIEFSVSYTQLVIKYVFLGNVHRIASHSFGSTTLEPGVVPKRQGSGEADTGI